MKTLLLSAVAVLILAAGTLSAEEAQTVLTPDNVLYTIKPGEYQRLDILRRDGEANQVLVVPETEDDAIESEARLIWDNVTSTLFAVWNHRVEERSEIRLAALNVKGEWDTPIVVAPSALAKRMDLQAVLTHAPTDVAGASATLLHLVWWNVGPVEPSADYALVAFENGAYVSTDVAPIESLDEPLASEALESAVTQQLSMHPPLTMVRRDTGVEIAYGTPRTSVVKRVLLNPRLRPDARMWRPGRSGGGSTPHSPLANALDGSLTHVIISDEGRIVLYTQDGQFRYSVFDGEWSAVRMIKLDEKVTSDQLITHLRLTVDGMAPIARSASSQ